QPELIARFSSDARLKVVRGPGFTSTLLQFNTASPPFNNAGLRRVIAGLIDYKGLVDTILLGNGTVGSAGFVHPDSPFYSASTREYPRFTVAQANQQLDSLGFRRGPDGIRVGRDGKKLDVTFLVQSNNPLRIRAAEIIAADLKQVGINLNVKSLDPTTVQQALWPDFDVGKGRNFEIAMWGWSAPVQAQLNLRGLFHSTPAVGTINVGGYKNPTINTLVERMATTIDLEDRKALAARVQSIVAQDLPFITLWYPEGVYAYNPSAYDGWKYQKGQGIINKHSFIRQ
ncbi:MAG TPA: ABC transporter substrate-binding protein, partial [Deinococcales bacterium]|nr:ABC transporter substrate-binding protein [Deinococcales bacterium]